MAGTRGKRAPRGAREIARALQEIYAKVPTTSACTGRCWDSCGPLPISRIERRRIADRTGVEIPERSHRDGVPLCPALGDDKRCTVYDVRPLICRLWGVVEYLPCSYGCTPDDGRPLLTMHEAYGLMAEVFEMSGQDRIARQMRLLLTAPPEYFAAMAPAMRAYTSNKIDNDGLRAALDAAGVNPAEMFPQMRRQRPGERP